MGSSPFDPGLYRSAASAHAAAGTTRARSAAAAATRDYSNIAECLDPRKLKNGIRECCYAPGFTDAAGIIVSIDGTGSMQDVPKDIQKALPDLIGLLVEPDKDTGIPITDRPNVMFMIHDDEFYKPGAVFQMSQFETGAKELLDSLNEMIIPGDGGGNNGESYAISVYAAARHTRLESFEQRGEKGFFFLIGDEPPCPAGVHGREPGDPTVLGVTAALAKELFGDTIQGAVSMLELLKEVHVKYHVYLIRPGHTNHGTTPAVKKLWADLFKKAGINPQNILEIPETEAIVPTIALTVGGHLGADHDSMVSVLRTKGVAGTDSAAGATEALVHVGAGAAAGSASGALATTDGGSPGGRKRR